MFEIVNIKARMILDSRGNPTVEAEVFTKEYAASAMVPSGASTGSHEALELRDNGKAYSGKGVNKVVRNINTKIKKALKGVSIVEQTKIDRIMIKLDNTKNKSNFGANAILAVSMACARCAAKCLQIPLWIHLANLADTNPNKLILPVPYCNVINGGKHAPNDLMFQEFMIVPQAKTFHERVKIVSEFYHALKKLIIKKYGAMSANVGDEGGFAPDIKTAHEALNLLLETRKRLKLGPKIKFAIDVAASEFYDKKTKTYEVVKGLKLDKKSFVKYYTNLLAKFPVVSIEDPFAEDDFNGFKLLNKNKIIRKLIKSNKLQIVGDDLLVTNPLRIKKAHARGLCNALLLKVNQIGSITEALNSANLAKSYGWKIMVSHRSGETEDSFIADLAVALGCGQIKPGAPCRSERTAKYNQLLRIEEEVSKFK